MQVEPFNLNPALLYPILKASTVKRTRCFIKEHFSNESIQDMDGQWKPICFPKPVARSIKYNLDEVLPGFFAELKTALAPPNRQPELTLARYQPDNYLLSNTANGADTTMVGLIRTALLKRFESSAYAFAQTTKKMVWEHKLFLEGLASGRIIKKDLIHKLSAADDEAATKMSLQSCWKRIGAANLRKDTTSRNWRGMSVPIRSCLRDLVGWRKSSHGSGIPSSRH